MPTHTVKITTLSGVTMHVTIARSLRLRVWIAVRLIRLAAWISGMGIHVSEATDVHD